MASDETTTFHSSLQNEDFDNNTDHGYDHYQHPHPHNLSRLSVCTSSGVDDDDEDVDNTMAMYASGLSIEILEGDGLSSDSENELGSCYTLPATPPRQRDRVGMASHTPIAVKDYASDNEAQKGVLIGQKTKKNHPCMRKRCRRIRNDRGVFDRANDWDNSERSSSKNKKKDEDHLIQGFSGESDQSTGPGVRVIARPKGGSRSLCMDLEEVKACRDLGFELVHERMLEVPSHLSISNSTLDISSDGNSPMANWRISSPGDDPRDVKARLKVWAQAVALASAYTYGT